MSLKPIDFPSRSEVRGAVEAMKREMADLIEYTRLLAEIRKEYFDSLVENGFSEGQAVELCKSYP